MPLKYFQNFEWGESCKISRVKYEDGIQLFEKGDQSRNTIYIKQDNMYILNQEQIDSIYQYYKDLEIYSFEGNSIIDPALDIGDILIIDNKKVIYQGASQYGGKFKADISSKIQCKAKEETMSKQVSQKIINRRVQSQIEQENARISQLVQESSEHKQMLVKHEQTLEGLNDVVSNTETKILTLEETIHYFSVDLDMYNLTIAVDYNKKPFLNNTFTIGYYSYFKGDEILAKAECSSNIAGISIQIEDSKIKISVDKDVIIEDLNNEITVTFSYIDRGTKYELSKKIMIALAIQGLQGAKGDTGAQGLKGDKGDTGAQGLKGDKGDTGPQGLKGDKGDTGLQGIQGPKGDNGTSYYFYVRYSANSTGNPMTETPSTSTQYMGVASTTSPSAPTSYSAYKWSKIKGEAGRDGTNGSAGAKGADGQTSYLHIKYSEDGSSFTPQENDYAKGEKPSAWIGQYVDFKEQDSEVFEDYTWYKFTENIDETIDNMKESINKTYIDLNNNYLTKEQVEAENKTLKESIEVIKQQQTTVTTTAQGLEVKIDSIIENGVKAIKNTTIDINENGITVGKSNSEFRTTMNNEGTYMYAYNNEIAKYDKDGATVKNIKVTGELETSNLRVMDVVVNSKKRTHIHWIGG